jgi:hypothetical protein
MSTLLWSVAGPVPAMSRRPETTKGRPRHREPRGAAEAQRRTSGGARICSAAAARRPACPAGEILVPQRLAAAPPGSSGHRDSREGNVQGPGGREQQAHPPDHFHPAAAAKPGTRWKPSKPRATGDFGGHRSTAPISLCRSAAVIETERCSVPECSENFEALTHTRDGLADTTRARHTQYQPRRSPTSTMMGATAGDGHTGNPDGAPAKDCSSGQGGAAQQPGPQNDDNAPMDLNRSHGNLYPEKSVILIANWRSFLDAIWRTAPYHRGSRGCVVGHDAPRLLFIAARPG